MNFRTQSTYNPVDSTVKTTKQGKRIVVRHGVKRRCQTILNAFNRVKNAPRSAFQMHRLLSKRYSINDVAYAFRKLVKGKMLERVSLTGDKHLLVRRRRNWKSLWKQASK